MANVVVAIKVVTDNRTFWNTVKPLLSEKVKRHP